MIVVVGIKSCDTCRKALAWLDSQALAHRFHDLRADGLDENRLGRWIDVCGWEVVLNRRSTTWRSLTDKEKADIDAAKVKQLMMTHPTLVKRPVFEAGAAIHIGFTDAVRQALL
jgi:arsenate reductase